MPSLLPNTRAGLLLFQLLAFLLPVRATYYIDGANSTIQFMFSPNLYTPAKSPGMEKTNIYDYTLSDMVCGPDLCNNAKIPFRGSGVTVSCVEVTLFAFNVSFTIDGGSPVFYEKDGIRGCGWSTPATCKSIPIHDVQSLPFGDHTLSISTFQWSSASTTFSLDAIAVNDTSAQSTTTTSVPSSQTKMPAIIGGCIGGITAIVSVILIILYNRRRIRNQPPAYIDPGPKSLETPTFSTDMSPPSSAMWSPAAFPPPMDVGMKRQAPDGPPMRMVPPMTVHMLPSLPMGAGPGANPSTPQTQISQMPAASRVLPLPTGTADIQLTDEEINFIHGLGSINVPMTDISRMIEQMRAERAAGSASQGLDAGSVGNTGNAAFNPAPPKYDFKN